MKIKLKVVGCLTEELYSSQLGMRMVQAGCIKNENVKEELVSISISRKFRHKTKTEKARISVPLEQASFFLKQGTNLLDMYLFCILNV